MMLTDREWLRFVTFAFVAGGVFGVTYTGALQSAGRSLMSALGGAVVGTGLLAIALHLVLRYLIDRASEPPADDTPTEDTA
jgi:hypothetical protein